MGGQSQTGRACSMLAGIISAQLIHQCELEIGHHIAGHMCANARSRCAKRDKRIILGNEHHV